MKLFRSISLIVGSVCRSKIVDRRFSLFGLAFLKVPCWDPSCFRCLSVTCPVCCSTANRTCLLMIFRTTFNLTPTMLPLLIVLRISISLPHFSYCDVVYFDGLRASDRKSLERAFNACLRFAYGLKKSQSVRGYEIRFMGCGLMQYLNYHTLTFVHNLILRKAPGYLFSKVQRCRSNRTFSVNVPYVSTSRAHDSLFVSGVARLQYVACRG